MELDEDDPSDENGSTPKDLFLSYAREDTDFVDRLAQAVERRGRSTWIDRAGIRKGDEWETEIYRSIRSATAFAFVISPDSAASRVTPLEIQAAVEDHKKIIPILHREADATKLPASIRKLNWIFMREEDDFDAACQDVVDVIDADFDWLRAHTRLLVATRDWLDEDGDSSRLWRGAELREAERLLEEKRDTPPLPTAQQSIFVKESRRLERSRKRRQGIAAAVLAALAFAVVFATQRAAENDRIAQSRSLALHANDSLESDPERSILLALHSLAATWKQDSVTLPEGEAALRNAIGASHVRQTLPAVPGAAADGDPPTKGLGAFSPNGLHLATARRGERPVLWTREDTSSRWHDPTVVDADIPTGLRLDVSNEGIIALADDAATVEMLGPEDGARPESLDTGERGRVHDLALTPDGRLVTGNAASRGATLWDLSATPPAAVYETRRDVHRDVVHAIDVDRAARRIATASWDGSVVLWNTRNPESYRRFEIGYDPVYGVALAPNGDLAAGSGNGRTTVIRPRGRDLLREGEPPQRISLIGHRSHITRVDYSPDGGLVATASADQSARLWRPDAGRQVALLRGHTDVIDDIRFDPSGRQVLTLSQDGSARIWDVASSSGPMHQIESGMDGPNTMRWMPDGVGLLVIHQPEEAAILEADTGEVLRRFAHDRPIRSVAVSAGSLVATGDESGRARLWTRDADQPISLEPLEPLDARPGENRIRALCFSADEVLLVALSETGRLGIYSTEDGQLLGTHDPYASNRTESPPAVARDVTFLGRTHRVIVANWDASIRSVDLTDPTHPVDGAMIRAHGGVTSIASATEGGDSFGDSFASSGADAIALVHPADPNAPPLPFHGHTGWVMGVALRRDGSGIASAGQDGTIRIWASPPDGAPPLVLRGHEGEVYSVAFSPDGERLASIGADHRLRVWELGIGSMVELALDRATRDLSREECGRVRLAQDCLSRDELREALRGLAAARRGD